MIKINSVKISETVNDKFIGHVFDDETKRSMRKLIQKLWPGNYQSNMWMEKQIVHVELVFYNNEDATWFALKYEV